MGMMFRQAVDRDEEVFETVATGVPEPSAHQVSEAARRLKLHPAHTEALSRREDARREAEWAEIQVGELAVGVLLGEASEEQVEDAERELRAARVRLARWTRAAQVLDDLRDIRRDMSGNVIS